MFFNPYSLVNKTILITGASSGIGRTTAITCSQMGAKVIATGRNEKRLMETYSLLVGEGHQSILADLSVEEEIIRLVAQLPILDGCVCNAGISKMSPVQFFTVSDMENIFKVNVFAGTQLVKNLLKRKRLNNPSSIVFTSSVGGVYNVAMANGIYSMSKCAVDAYMRTAALELAQKGIRCNSVNPGMTWTNLIKDSVLSDEQMEADLKNYPLRRYGRPEDIAYAIVYLLSEASSWVTGTALRIDGGFSLGK